MTQQQQSWPPAGSGRGQPAAPRTRRAPPWLVITLAVIFGAVVGSGLTASAAETPDGPGDPTNTSEF